MFFPILLGFFTAFFALAFVLLHLLASLSEVKKGNHTLGNTFLLIGSSLATLSIFLYFFLPIIALSLWLIGCGLICYGAYWNGKQRKPPSSPPPDSDGHRSGPYHLVSLGTIKKDLLILFCILIN